MPPPMLSPAAARQRASEHLAGFPPQITEHYIAFATMGASANLDIVVLGMLHFYLAKRPESPLTDLPGTTRLREDLGVDSLTMIDLLFLTESVFDLKLAEDELGRITTLDELRRHFRERLGHACGQEA